MVNNRNDVDLQFNFEINQADVRKTRQAVRGVTTELEKFGKQDAKLAQSAARTAKAVSGQVLPFDKLAKATGKAAKGERKLESETKKSTKALKEQSKVVSGLDARLERLDTDFSNISRQVGQAGDIESNIRAISGAAGTIPGLQGLGAAGGAGAEFFAVLEAAPRLKTAFKGFPDILEASAKSLGTSSLGLIGGIGAVGLIAGAGALAINVLTRSIEEQIEAVRRAAEARQIERDVTRDFNALIESGNIAGAVAERNRLFQESANLVRDLAAEEEILLLSRLQSKGGTFDVNPFVAGIQTLNPVVEEQVTVINELADKSALANIALQVANDALAELSPELIEAAVQAAELAERERELTVERQARVQEINATAQLERRLASAQNQTSAQVEARIEAITAEDAVLANQILALQEAGVNTDALVLKLQNLAIESIELRDVILPLIRAREAETDLLQRQSAFRRESREAAVEDVRDSRQRVADLQKINEDMEKAQADHVLKLASIADKLSKVISSADIKRSESIAKAESTALDARSEATRKANKDAERLQAQHQANIAKINRRANASLANAIGNRDALAFKAAQEAQQTALKEENDSFKDRKDAIDDSLKETNRLVSKRLGEQRAAAEEQYSRTVDSARAAAREQEKIEIDRHNALILIQREAMNKVIQDAADAQRLLFEINRAGSKGNLDVHSQFWASALAQAQASLDKLEAQAATSTTTISPTSPIVSGTGRGNMIVPIFHEGGIMQRTGLAFVERGEQILTRQQQNQRGNGGGGVTVNIGRISGANRKQITEQIFFEIENALDEANIN